MTGKAVNASDTTIDLNADLGEGETTDDDLLGIVSSCNIACGGHAGDRSSMAVTLMAARDNGVVAGAHPSYPDRVGFGRRSGFTPAAELAPELVRQVSGLIDVAVEQGVELRHVKPHGALYNDAARDPELAAAVCHAVRRIGPLALVGPPGSELERAAERAGIHYFAEGFVDRAYTADGALVPRSEPGSVYDEPAAAARQATAIATRGAVTAINGETVPLAVTTLCIHGDSPGAVASATAVVEALQSAGVTIRAPE